MGRSACAATAGCLEVLVSGNAMAGAGPGAGCQRQKLLPAGKPPRKPRDHRCLWLLRQPFRGCSCRRTCGYCWAVYRKKGHGRNSEFTGYGRSGALVGDLLEGGDVLLDSLSLSFLWCSAALSGSLKSGSGVATIGPKTGVLGAATVVIQQFLSKRGRY